MKTIEARNVHQALPKGLRLLETAGVTRGSRNGAVRMMPCPVATVYERPTERLAHWIERDVNVAFLLYEGLWMLAGRQDLQPLLRYIKNFGLYSTNGETLHGAYGHRWRWQFGFDQLAVIAERLTKNPNDRRSVLQIWDAQLDLKATDDELDVPCNDTVAFQRAADGSLDMTVFCRSNDIVWGCYFANAFHFSLLQEYLAAWIGCAVGRYTQVSVNWHAYVARLDEAMPIAERALSRLYATPEPIEDPYVSGEVATAPLVSGSGPEAVADFDRRVGLLLASADDEFDEHTCVPADDDSPFFRAAYAVLNAHQSWRNKDWAKAMRRLGEAGVPQDNDMVASMRRWLERRQR